MIQWYSLPLWYQFSLILQFSLALLAVLQYLPSDSILEGGLIEGVSSKVDAKEGLIRDIRA